MNIELEHHLTIDEDGITAIDVLSVATGLSRQCIKQVMHKGAVWHSQGNKPQRLRRASKRLNRGDILHLYYNEHILSQTPPTAELIADEQAYSIWYKPSGMFSQGSRWGDHCTIRRWVEQHLQPERPAFIVHRLDRAASGLILLAHKKQMAAAFSKLFQDRQMEKHYRAIVHGHFPDQPQVINNDIDGRSACSTATCIEYNDELQHSLLEIKIDSGRKHQIRRHLSAIGFPIIGDRLYGNSKDTLDLQLTAIRLAFVCPVSGQQKSYQLNQALLPRL